MGWKGTLRTVTSVARQMEREAQRRQKQAVKEQIAADAAHAVGSWEGYIDDLVSIHTGIAQPIDWNRILQAPKPAAPHRQSTHEDAAKALVSDFRPTLLGRIFGKAESQRAEIERALRVAPQKDEAEFEKANRAYENALAEWHEDRSHASKVIAGERSAIGEVLAELEGVWRESKVGTSVQFQYGNQFVHAIPLVHSEDIVPNFRRSQLASGKLKQTKMPTTQFNELYQDYVASVALRVAGEIFRVLPIEEVFVTCNAELLNSSTGHKEPTPILSVQFVRSTFYSLALARIDPSDSLSNFNHKMAFSKSKGFSAITPLASVPPG